MHFKNQFSWIKILTVPSKKSKSCKSSGSRGRTSEKSSWFNSKSFGMSVISLAMSSGNSSALSSGVEGLLGKMTRLAYHSHFTFTPSHRKQKWKILTQNNLLAYFKIWNQKADLSTCSHIFLQLFTHVLREGNHFEILFLLQISRMNCNLVY